MIPRANRYPRIIMELKWKKNLNENALEALANKALSQIDERRYDSEMNENAVKDILKLGIAFSGNR